jgi:hypothetical protein
MRGASPCGALAQQPTVLCPVAVAAPGSPMRLRIEYERVLGAKLMMRRWSAREVRWLIMPSTLSCKGEGGVGLRGEYVSGVGWCGGKTWRVRVRGLGSGQWAVAAHGCKHRRRRLTWG